MVILSVGLFLFSVAAQGSSVVELPAPSTEGTLSVERTIARRRSIGNFSEKQLSLEEISQLLWAAQGITDRARGYRSAPSAGATYPLGVYLSVVPEGVGRLSAGVYRYLPAEHGLERTLGESRRLPLREAALGQAPVSEAPVTVVVVAEHAQTTSVYGSRRDRYVHLETGHVGQNIYLQAGSLGLGTVVIGAFQDREVQKVMDLLHHREPLYIIPVGYPEE
ncbi:MAG: SagB/ThcOx family dehydrogenase [Candidatus Acetothermia bacterium]